MDITRREFLGYTAGAISVVGLRLPESTPTANRLRKFDKWRVLDTTGRPSIPESALGYHAAIPVERQRFEPWERSVVCSCSLLIYPSLLVINQIEAAARKLQSAFLSLAYLVAQLRIENLPLGVG